jgi:hypothetical protein
MEEYFRPAIEARGSYNDAFKSLSFSIMLLGTDNRNKVLIEGVFLG